MLEDEKEPKKNSKVLVIITFIVIGLTFFVSGYNVKGIIDNFSKPKEEEKKEEKEEKKEETVTPVKDDVPYTDKVVYSTYGGGLTMYLIDNGSVYYKTSASLFAGLNVCPSKEEYCKGNPTYNNDMNKIDGLEGIKRLKYVVDLAASDERFTLFAISEEGSVYRVDGSKVTKLEYSDIKDLVNVSMSESTYEFSTNKGETIKYQVKGGGAIEKVEE